MESPTYVTLSAQVALRKQLAVVANNVANSSTAGYKADRQLFQTYESKLNLPGQSVAFVQDRATYIDRAAGALENTQNPLDVAIQGDGYLAVQSKDGKGYSRDGKLQIATDGTLVDGIGRAVLGADGSTISIPPGSNDIKIAGDGTLSLTANGQRQEVGQIGLYKAANPIGLRKSGSGAIDGAAAQMAPVQQGDTTTRLVQGAIETSTVQPVVELTRIKDLTEAYERLQQLIGDDNDRMTKMIDQLGRTT